MDRSNIIVVYPGRFQPFHKGHKSVFEHLKKDWPNVYIATTNKVQPGKSPFNFQDKLNFMEMLGIDRNNVLEVKNTYNGQEYIDQFGKKFTASDTGLIMVVSEKDMVDDPRFNFPNMGVSLKKDGNPAYLQKFTHEDDMKSMAEHGYIMTAPIFPFKIAGHDLDSASQIRELMKGDEELAKQVFVDLYDKYNEDLFKLIREKLMITEQEILDLNYMRKIAGLNEIDVEDDDYAVNPGYKEMPMFDQLGKIIDSDEMSKDGDDIKNPKSTVKTDDGSEVEVSVGEAKAVRKMLNMLGSNRGADAKSPREKFQDAIQKEEGLTNMIEFANSKGLVEESDVEEGNAFAKKVRDLKAQGKKKGDKFEFEDEEYALEDLDLNDIRYDYGVKPVSEGGNAFDIAMTDAEDIIMTCQDQEECLKELEALIVDNADDWDSKYANEVVQDYITMVVDKGIEGAKEYVEQQDREPEGAPLESKGSKPDYIDIDGDGDKEEPMKKAVKDKNKKDESFDARAEQSREEEAYNELVDAYDKGGEEALCKAIGCSEEELDQEMTEFAMDRGLHMDDDRDEVIHGYIEDLVDNADWKDHGEPEVDEDIQRMRDLAGIEESNPKRERAAQILHDLVEPDIDNFESRDALEQFMSDNMPEFYRGRDTGKAIEDAIELLSPNHKIPEAEYQGKKVELNKPKRGGSKKYYVYVKTPKGNVKKISFGDPGLKTKSGNKARAKSFAARHNCEKKNDKQKAGYWACRLPRYGLVKGGKWW